jgi:hypothetical protein
MACHALYSRVSVLVRFCDDTFPRSKFAAVDKMFRATMSKVLADPLAIVVMSDENLLSSFSEAHKMLDSVQKGLNDYLETKRAVFPRFFFLSNDELLDILAETRDPKRVIPHLPKCFEGICDVCRGGFAFSLFSCLNCSCFGLIVSRVQVLFDSEVRIVDMRSAEGERVILQSF